MPYSLTQSGGDVRIHKYSYSMNLAMLDATTDDGSCNVLRSDGCTDPIACNYALAEGTY